MIIFFLLKRATVVILRHESWKALPLRAELDFWYREAEGVDHLEGKSIEDIIYILHGDKHQCFFLFETWVDTQNSVVVG